MVLGRDLKERLDELQVGRSVEILLALSTIFFVERLENCALVSSQDMEKCLGCDVELLLDKGLRTYTLGHVMHWLSRQPELCQVPS